MKTKTEIRAILKNKRAALPPERKKEMDLAIAKRIAQSKAFAKASMLLLYAPLANEINLLSLVRIARKMGKPVAFPRCDTATNTMQFYILEPDARLVEGAYRIYEPPANAPLCRPDAKALCILPALTFDLSGARLGYGKGYYDRFLATFPGMTMGAAYESFLVKALPTDPHDLPVSMIATDCSMYVCQAGARETGTGAEPKGRGKSRLPSAFAHLWAKFLKASGLDDTTDGRSLRQRLWQASKRAHHAAPLLVCGIFLLLLLTRLADTWLTNRTNETYLVLILQILIFLVPAAVFGIVRRKKDFAIKHLRLRLPRLNVLWFTACMLIVMITGGMLCEILTGGIASLDGNFTLYDTFVARTNGGVWTTIYLLLAYCVLPAFCEELIFRAILCSEYERFGVGVAITASALFFSMLHFSFSSFLTYLLLGALLAAAMYTTRSFLTAFVLHLLYNVFCLLGQPYLSAFYVYAGSNETFIFCLVVLCLLFGAFAVGEARKLYHRYARANLDSSYTVDLSIRQQAAQLVRVIISPATAVCLLIWLIASIV